MANGNPVILGKSDSATKQTTITALTPTTQEALRVQNLSGTGIAAGALQGTALTAGSVGGTAVMAESFAGSGVISTCIDTRDVPNISVAVSGTVPGGFGVLGFNARGQFPQSGVTGRGMAAIGVDGISRSGFGVRGMTFSNAISGAGVMGIGNAGHGVIGIAMKNYTTPFIPPPFASSGPLFAGLFFGNVQVQGDFTVTGHKSAVVPHPDGTHRRLYCVESPEAWFEDFGAARLVHGRATVALEKTFARLVASRDYHVFITPEGDCNGLYVHRKSARGFEVRELQKGASTLRFSFRIVARRRDVKGKRLEVVELGHVPEKAITVVAEAKSPRQARAGRFVSELAALARRRGQGKKVARRAKKK